MRYTRSYERLVPEPIRRRYDIREVRNGAAVLAATNPEPFADLLAVLDEFTLTADDIRPGGNETDLAARLNKAFRSRGWREGRHDIHVAVQRTLRAPGEPDAVATDEIDSAGYWIDNVKQRAVVDVEWNAKDGNLDRDLRHYRALYEHETIDAAAMITRTVAGLRRLGRDLGRPSWLATSTTTNLPKLEDRLAMGGAGGCPFIVFAITERCFAGEVPGTLLGPA